MGSMMGVLFVFLPHFNYEQTYMHPRIVKHMTIGASDPPLKNKRLLHITKIANVMHEVGILEVRMASRSQSMAEEQL